MTTNTLTKLMEQAQVFASAWSLVGGRFDSGNGLADAEAAKAELCEMIEAALTAQALQLEAEERDASERAKAQATRLCDDFERLGAINRSKWVSTNHGKWEGMAIAYEQAALKCRRAAIASEAAT